MNSLLIMTRRKKDQDMLLLKTKLDTEVKISLIYSLLLELEIHQEPPFSKSYVKAN